ncbi:MAG: UPF0149 family protein [Methylococcales bacterium]|nr:UPF0149 family protein [Methylococcales bacterium]MBT7442556.1 UPF0149 family protein [Methylococcales bacterium]
MVYPEYEAVQLVLNQVESEMTVSEAHGVLCGVLVVNLQAEAKLWVTEVVEEYDPNDVLLAEKLPVLNDLYQATVASITDAQMGFELFLPADEQLLTIRTEAMKTWVEGFLYGVALGNFDMNKLSADGKEVIRDFTELTKIDVSDMEIDEVGENSLIEIIEYLRVTVMFLAQELHPASSEETVH